MAPMVRPVAALAAFVLAACDGAAPQPVGETSGAIIGGTRDYDHDAVVALDLAGYGLCSGTVVAPRVILTAAHCVQFLVDDGIDEFIIADFGENALDPDDYRWAERAVYNKRYREESVGVFDVAMVLLLEDAPVAPVPMNEADLDEVVALGVDVHSVGYGLDGNGGIGLRRHADLPLDLIKARHIVIGKPGLTICNGDSGGPDFFTFEDGVERVVGVHSFGLIGCTGASTSMRVDAFLDEFFYPLLDAWDGPCRTDGVCVTEGCRSVDADCDACGFDGACVRECALPDLDCPLGGLPGDPCAEIYDCESRECIGAPDDARITYCTDECDPANPLLVCGGPMACELQPDGRHLCVFTTPTPSAQGYRCWDPETCRSGLCDEKQHICVEACDPAAANACPDPWTCQDSALAPHVCRGVDVVEGTRDLSSLCGASGHRGGPGAALLVLAALAITRGRWGGRRGGGSGGRARRR